jgi:hypothetical protein
MQINVTYDSSIANAPSGFLTAFTAAVQYYENLITNPVTANIDVGWGEVEGFSLASNAYAENFETWESGYSYSQVASALQALGSPGASTLPSVDPTNGAPFTMTSAEAKALGLIAPNASVVDAYVGFSTNANYNFSLTNQNQSGAYDFYGIVIHELSQVLGRQITEGAGSEYSPMDLYHYSAPGVRDLNNAGGYFSTDLGVTDINNFNQNANWGDPGDWTNATEDDFDQTAYPGEAMPLSQGDLTVMESLGWNLSSQQAAATLQAVTLTGTVLYNGTGGNQSITGGSYGDETVWGGIGDVVVGGGANMTVGGSQAVTTIGGTGYSFLDGSAGHDSIIGGASGSEMIWSGLADTIYGGGAADDTIGGVIGDTIIGGTGSEFIDGSAGGQIITGGSAGGETIWGGAGDTVYGGGNANVVIGGGLGDTIIGGTGTELLSGWRGDQYLQGGSAGNETIVGAPGDTVVGGSGGNEFIGVDAGNQSFTGGSGGNETVWGGANDTISGGGAANETIGGVPFDTITGGTGAEFIDGSQGNQLIVAGSGSETIWGGSGDTITGGAGHAIIGLGSGPTYIGADTASGGSDTVAGFSVAAGDRILLPSPTTTAINTLLATASTAGGSTTITFSSGAKLTLSGITHIDSTFFN